MRTNCRLLIVAVLLIVVRTPAGAQTVYGPGGLFVHPSAFTGPKGDLGLNISWFEQEEAGAGKSEWLPVSLTYGLSDRAQIGVLYLDRRYSGSHHDSEGVFAKYQFVPDSATRPAIGIAGSFLDGDIEQSSLSGVVSHRFERDGRTVFTGHAGIQWARRSDGPDDDDDVGVFAGFQLPFARDWSVLGEIGTRLDFNREAASAIGVQWSGPGVVSVGVGYVNTGRSDDNRFFVGVGYRFGGGRR